MNFSVIICCYNSEKRLPETLQYMAKQELNTEIQWELIIVDNNSTDQSQTIAKKEWEKAGSPCPLIIVEEKQAGLSYARHKGVETSKYDTIIFCDDDNWFFPNYIQESANLFNQYPNLGIVGGYGIPVYEKEPEQWFLDKDLARGLATGQIMEQSGLVNDTKGYIFGAGMVIKKDLFKSVHQLPFLCEDRKGKNLSSGGDVEICYRALLLGYDIWYENTMKFYHYIPDGRCSLNYQLRLSYGKSYSSAYLNLYKMVLKNHPYLYKNFKWLRILFSRLKSYIRNFVLNKHSYTDEISYQLEKQSLMGYIKGHLSLWNHFNKELQSIIQFKNKSI